ncbi:MAG TPA: FtsX-like permease family protein, partial [Candidatus Synoicihabitans sp.]|nr:FtsX-like permease family protein [Candidatus Synoicihabitans sp.]
TRSLDERRVTLYLLGIFAAVALALASLGVYGVMSYTISQRQRELSIRMALGAQRSDVVSLVLRDGWRLGLIGIVLGLLAGLAGSELIASRLYEIGARDVLVFTVSASVIALVVALSVYLPARRAARADALLALRAE